MDLVRVIVLFFSPLDFLCSFLNHCEENVGETTVIMVSLFSNFSFRCNSVTNIRRDLKCTENINTIPFGPIFNVFWHFSNNYIQRRFKFFFESIEIERILICCCFRCCYVDRIKISQHDCPNAVQNRHSLAMIIQ